MRAVKSILYYCLLIASSMPQPKVSIFFFQLIVGLFPDITAKHIILILIFNPLYLQVKENNNFYEYQVGFVSEHKHISDSTFGDGRTAGGNDPYITKLITLFMILYSYTVE